MVCSLLFAYLLACLFSLLSVMCWYLWGRRVINKIVKTFQTVVFVVVMFWITGQFIVDTFDMVG